MTQTPLPQTKHKPIRPILFFVLYLPAGIILGYLSVLPFRYAEAGVPTWNTAVLLSAPLIIQMLKFLWAPLVDAVWTIKKWYVFSGFICVGCIIMQSFMHPSVANLGLAFAINLLVTFLISFSMMGVSVFAVFEVPDKKKA